MCNRCVEKDHDHDTKIDNAFANRDNFWNFVNIMLQVMAPIMTEKEIHLDDKKKQKHPNTEPFVIKGNNVFY